MKIAITGATGNMGQETLKEVLKIKEIEHINLLVLEDDKRGNKLLKDHKKDKQRLTIIRGNLANRDACEKLISDCDYVINLAACIPPHSDQNPQKAIECNEVGVDTIVSVIEGMKKQPKFIDISTMALYGNRNHLHPWGRVGDPLLVSPYDIYSATKLRGEFRVLESEISCWVILRQTAMLHINMLRDNMSDGLMFHTCFNAPLEWATAHDSGVLIANILKADINKKLKKDFWHKCYNIGCHKNRITGFDTLNDGFKIIGGSAKDFFRPNYDATRNFHGMWFYDSHVLDNLFHYQSQDTAEYWNLIGKKYWYYKLGKIVPKKLIKKFAIDRLLKNYNCPYYWHKHNDEGKMQAYFGGKDKFEAISKKWKDFDLLVENRAPEGEQIDYNALRDIKNAKLIDYGYDIDKPDSKITIEDLKNVAKMHGGKLISKTYNGNMQEKLLWQNQDGEKFTAKAYTVIKAGHWLNRTYKENVWDFDRLSKKDKIYAQIWYDSHTKDENYIYSFDENFNSKIERFE